jgi:hypothetical protein
MIEPRLYKTAHCDGIEPEALRNFVPKIEHRPVQTTLLSTSDRTAALLLTRGPRAGTGNAGNGRACDGQLSVPVAALPRPHKASQAGTRRVLRHKPNNPEIQTCRYCTGGSAILGGPRNCLNVRFTAPLEVRSWRDDSAQSFLVRSTFNSGRLSAPQRTAAVCQERS